MRNSTGEGKWESICYKGSWKADKQQDMAGRINWERQVLSSFHDSLLSHSNQRSAGCFQMDTGKWIWIARRGTTRVQDQERMNGVMSERYPFWRDLWEIETQRSFTVQGLSQRRWVYLTMTEEPFVQCVLLSQGFSLVGRIQAYV